MDTPEWPRPAAIRVVPRKLLQPSSLRGSIPETKAFLLRGEGSDPAAPGGMTVCYNGILPIQEEQECC